MKINYKYKSKRANSVANVLITGGNGNIGKYLCAVLLSKDYAVATIGRKTNKANNYFWDIENQEIEKGALENADYIIHLAGAGIADKKWTIARKKEILDSRVKSVELIYKYLKKNNLKPRAFISASAIGYYGAITSETIFAEEADPAIDFLGTICSKLESKVNNFTEIDIRTVAIRTGIVLMENGGALQKMITPIKLGIGSSLGSGKQYIPWIHISDLCNVYLKAIEDNQIKGAYNAVAPEHVNYNQFGRAIAKILKRHYYFPNIPAFIVKFIFGKRSVILLKGSRVSSEKIVSKGFDFQFVRLNDALRDIVK